MSTIGVRVSLRVSEEHAHTCAEPATCATWDPRLDAGRGTVLLLCRSGDCEYKASFDIADVTDDLDYEASR